MSTTKLTVKQQRFIDLYDGNATDAARKAGYKNPERSAKHLVRNGTIQAELKKREARRNRTDIATREERQAAWTAIAFFDIRRLADSDGKVTPVNELDDISAKIVQGIKTTETFNKEGDLERKLEYKLPDRLKAFELLGRSEADFTDNTKDLTPQKPKEIEATGPLGQLIGKVYVREAE